MGLIPSPKPLLSKGQRGVSRVVWAKWLLSFGFWELTGDLRFVPWKTLSETAWDVERSRPGTRKALLAFLLGLAAHIRYRTELRPAIVWGWKHADAFDKWLEEHGGS